MIAGEYAGARGPAHTFTPITMLDVQPPRRRGRAGLVARQLQRAGGGRQGAGARPVTSKRGAGELILFANDGERLELSAREDSHVILLAGEPINEPIVQYGPFVMNTVDEIGQAMIDVNSGKFGPVPE